MNGNNKWRILVVDDEATNIDALGRILMPMYDVVVAKNGQSALNKALKHMPDLILLDVVMPDMSGFEVISLLKNSEKTSKIPVVFITGLDGNDDEEKGFLLGAVDYITKPFNSSIVKARVRAHLQIVEYINTIERMCHVDALTNVANRRGYEKRLRQEWDRAFRERTCIAVLMIDIDHFKKYNDTYGHPQGDELLKAVAATIRSSLKRPGDFVARYGGEEFVALLPNTNMSGALKIGEEIRSNVECMSTNCTKSIIANVTISLGVNSEIPCPGRSVAEFLSLADQALYQAKETGRNRVCKAIVD